MRSMGGSSKHSVSTFSVLSPADTGAHMISAEDVALLTPEDVRPLTKAESRKKIGKNKRCKKGTTAILTDSPNLKEEMRKGSFIEEKSCSTKMKK
ncbi:hypothetical protein AVEN_58612-1 [Araneus ventricosus]|uniref:Uncharacterized protein n=1 Tax=Araneus ventricosus TaxID=182803 RepID=A0A4Y2WLQ0_ARAVE|nr:hypothetical protein AVEN_201478-1 [Araneus ventricosus]GBO36893.1 hypothetical protein AVEN_58612-1 [Araneus ventricosus]